MTYTRAVYVILRAKVTYSLDREEITGALITRQVGVHLQSGVEGAMAQRLANRGHIRPSVAGMSRVGVPEPVRGNGQVYPRPVCDRGHEFPNPPRGECIPPP